MKRAAALVLAGLAACRVGPDYERPEVALPEQFQAQGSSLLDEDARWWRRFEDPKLDELIGVALIGNRDLLAAAERVREARAIVEIEGGMRMPMVDGSVAAGQREPSTSVAGGQFMPQDAAGYHALGFDAFWELDIFGHTARAIEAAEAGVGIAEEDVRGVLQRLIAEIARTYVELRGVERELELVRTNLTSQRDTAQLVRARVEAGLDDDLETARVDGLVASTAARLPALESARASRVHALAVLLGEFPAQTSARLAVTGAIPVPPRAIPTGLPVDLVRRRPDVRRSERELARAAALTAAATTELYPRLSLSAAFGWESQDLGDLFDSTSRTFRVGPSLSGPIFRSGIIQGGIEARTAQQQQALYAHEQALLEALRDVEDALVSLARTAERLVSLEQSFVAQQRAVALARDRYQNGLSDFLGVLDAERTLLEADTELTRGRAEHCSAAVALYKALGGGWEIEADVPALAAGREAQNGI